jgi:hypothetical protein
MTKHVDLALADAANGNESLSPRRCFANRGHWYPECFGDFRAVDDRDVRLHDRDERPNDDRRQ